jgi:hypothetical protein
MDISLHEELVEKLGKNALRPYGINDDKIRWGSTKINLRKFSNNQIRALRELLVPHKADRKISKMISDINVWISAAENGVDQVKCKSLQHFETLAYEYIQGVPKHRLYTKSESREGWEAYYVGKIAYYTPSKYERAKVIIGLYYMELGVRHGDSVTFRLEDVRGKTVPDILRASDYLPESPELLADYEGWLAIYDRIAKSVGTQFWARGLGTTNLDGNRDDEDRRSYWWRSDSQSIVMDKDGEPSKVVIDVISEGDKQESAHDKDFNADFWRTKSYLTAADDADPEVIDGDDDDVTPDDSEDRDMSIAMDIPTRFVVPTFDLRRHLRLRMHVMDLAEYVYDVQMGAKLVLPSEVRDLVNLLVSDKSEFHDIVKGKGGGAVILCAGPPGCGKTLTAEVYSEVMRLPLYSVQCSQLGTDEEDLEKELLKVFARAQRWNAILLLDEADVYVAARGADLKQNAIVGVFLRVLEYYKGVLFMTTNRSDLVDDAITSRCLARIDYEIPTPEDQARIWHVLAASAGIELAENAVLEIVDRYPKLSGRDVKQLLKLAAKVMSARGEPELTTETVEFVKRFKPTPGDGREEDTLDADIY